MLDILTIGLLARSRGNIAERRGHPRGAGVWPTVGLGLGLELAGTLGGYSIGGKVAAFGLGILGLTIGLLVAVWWVDRLPDLVQAREDAESPEQAAGRSCDECGEKIILEADGRVCGHCSAPVHLACRRAHRTRAHKKKPRAQRVKGTEVQELPPQQSAAS